MEYLKAEERSKTAVKLSTHLPGTIRGSKSKIPVLLPGSLDQQRCGVLGLTTKVDWEDLRGIDYVLVEFSSASGREVRRSPCDRNMLI